MYRPLVRPLTFHLLQRSYTAKSDVQPRLDEVISILKAENIYDEKTLRKELDYVVNVLKFPPSYFISFQPKQLADQLLAILSAKMVTRRSGSTVEFQLETPEYAMYCCAMTPDLLEKMDANVQRYSRATPENFGPTAAFFQSEGNIAPDIPHKLAVVFVNRSRYPSCEIDETMKTLAPEEFWDYSPSIQARYEDLLKRKSESLTPVTTVHVRPDGGRVVAIAYNKTARQAGFWRDLNELLERGSMVANRKFAIRFANNVLVYSFYIPVASDEDISTFLHHAALLDIIPNSNLQPLLYEAQFSANHIAYAHAATMFAFYFGAPNVEEYNVLKRNLSKSGDSESNLVLLKALNRRLQRGPQENYAHEVIRRFPELVSKMYDDFVDKCNGIGVGQFNTDLKGQVDKLVGERADRHVLLAFLQFNAHVRKTNFFQPLKSALSFRLDPHFLAHLDFPDIPHGIFLLLGRDFKGFHVRFRDIARGGVRMIKSTNEYAYETNHGRLFDECYGLAYTQQKKNKDIPEGGSKGNFLLQYGYQGSGFLSFERYMDAFLDVLLPNPYVKDNVGQDEIIFFGPDEGTADWMSWAALYSKQRGYRMWKSLTTGKPPAIGGIPHDVYQMTTLSVHAVALEVMKKLGWNEEEVTKLQTGGPDGDLGSNEIKISKDKTIGIVDGSGVVFDPKGLDRDELNRLATNREMIEKFDKSKLGPGGFKVLIEEKNVTLPSGELVDDGLQFRNFFHLHPLAQADIFVPCGGRPEAVNVANVSRLFLPDGKPKFKVIVEGANLFITEDARLILERAGVILYKDATANKGGVTSSSWEVLSGLALSDEEHSKWMCMKEDGVLPEFYKRYVAEIQQRVVDNARAEFDCIWREHEATKIPRTLLSNQLSDKINQLDDYIRRTGMFDNEVTKLAVMRKALPRTLLQEVGIEKILQRVPDSYQRAIFSNFIASHYVYQYGLEANEVGFFEFMKKLLE